MAGSGIASNNLPYAEVNCPGCGTATRYYDLTDSAFYGCASCHTFFRQLHDEEPQILRRFSADEAFAPVADIGHAGYLQGKKFVVVGYMLKYDPNENITWKEYMLLNPQSHSYHVLAESMGEWFVIWESEKQDFNVVNTNVMNPQYTVVESLPFLKYDFYTGYTFKILYAAGEFNYNILEDEDTLQVEEYENAPDMVVSETKEGKTTWYRGKCIPVTDLIRSFNINTSRMPRMTGVFFSIDPVKFYDEWNILWRFTSVIALLAFAAFIYFGIARESRLLASEVFTINKSQSGWAKLDPINASVIKVNSRSPVAFTFVSTLVNQWVEVSVTLTNMETGRNYEFTKAIEYYTGYEGGERWTEGDQEASAVLSSVEPGNYQVNIYPATEAVEEFNIVMTVEQDTVLWSNILLCLGLILAYPAIQLYRKRSYEQSFSGI